MQEQGIRPSPAKLAGHLRPSPAKDSVKLEPPSPNTTGPAATRTARAANPAAASPETFSDNAALKSTSPPPLASLFSTTRSSTADQQPRNAITGSSNQSGTRYKTQAPERAATPEPTSLGRSSERGRVAEGTSPQPPSSSTAAGQTAEQSEGGAAEEAGVGELSGTSRNRDADVSGAKEATKKAEVGSRDGDGQHIASDASPDPTSGEFISR